jgi:hypothetical protein
MGEGTNSRVMATDRPYAEFYDFYSVSPEYFGYHHTTTYLNVKHRVRGILFEDLVYVVD